MNAVSADSGKPWSIAPDERTAALEIVLLKRTYVLPWDQDGTPVARADLRRHQPVRGPAGPAE